VTERPVTLGEGTERQVPRSAAWNSNGTLLAVGFEDRRVCVGSLRRNGDNVPEFESLPSPPFTSDAALDWHPKTDWLAGMLSGAVAFWNSESKNVVKTTAVYSSGLCALDWSPDGKLLSVDSNGIGGAYRFWPDLENPTLKKAVDFPGDGYGVGWSQTSDRFAYIVAGREEAHVVALSGSQEVNLQLPSQPQGRLAWSSRGQTLAVPVSSIICIANPENGQVIAEVKGHTSLVPAVAFSADARLMASVGWDNTIRLWAPDDWRLLATIELSDSSGVSRTNWVGLRFHPFLPLLCSIGTEGGASLYELEIDGLLGAPAAPVKRYATAKVVLVGESGVGKTGLAYRLATGQYKEHSSTHGQQFWVVDSISITRRDGLRCEVVLWDLAGQPDYRLIHVLFLDDADAALLVLDASRRYELLDVVTFWIKALDAARARSCVKILVSARTDRGNAAVSAEELREFAKRFGIETAFVETSALTGAGLPELARVLQDHLNWDDLPMVVETSALAAVKAEVLRLKEQQSADLPLVTARDLQARLEGQASQAEIDASARDLQLHGFVHVLRAADGSRLVLLRPELLNNLAASFILEARRNERGLGALDEAAVLADRYRFPELDGLGDEQRRVLTEAATVLFLEHNVCFREALGDQVLLIFPELINEKPPTLADAIRFTDDVTYLVTGSIENVYASLVVLLGYTNVLRRKDQWRNQARYELDGYLLHFRQERPRDDQLQIVLSYPDGVPAYTKRVFQGLVEQFLRRRQASVRMYPRVECPECGYTLPQAQVIQFVDEGAGLTYCPRGGHQIPLLREPDRMALSDEEKQVLKTEATAAKERTAFAVVATQLRGYVAKAAGHRRSVVAFVSYAWGEPAVEGWVRDRLAPDLEQAGIEVVLDRANIRVGDNLARFVERIQAADRVLVIATPAYAQKYNNAAGAVVAAEADVINLRLLGTEEQKATVLPVLLAGDRAESLPALMQTRIYADFRDADRYFVELFELVLALHDLSPDLPALTDLHDTLLQSRQT
jgi:small GTP-binding protein